MEEEMQLEIAGETGRRICNGREESLLMWMCAVGIVGKAGRDLRSRVLRVVEEA